MSRSLAGLAPPRQLVATATGRIEDHAERYVGRDTVREMTLIVLKAEAMAEGLSQGLGLLISHTNRDGDTVQCVFERGIVTKSVM